MRNWCGLVEFNSSQVEEPTSLPALQQVVASAGRVRALGTGHSFNDLADTSGVHVSVAGLPADLEIDSSLGIARVGAGIRIGELARLLAPKGWALPTFASLGHISVAGATATGTHGSGDRNQTLSASVRWIEFVTAEGEIYEVDASDPGFGGMVVNLGSLGVACRIGVVIEPAFEVRQYVFDGVGHETLRDHFDEIFSSAYSVSFFTKWDRRQAGQVWMKRREGRDAQWQAEEWMGGTLCATKQHPLPGHDPMHCTEQQGIAGPSYERLPHFKLEFTPSSGEELQTEYLIPRAQAVSALEHLEELAPRIAPLLHISEIRTMAADDLWLSGAYGRDTVGIHFTWHKDLQALDVLPELDEFFGAYSGRAHWGKLHATPVDAYQHRYPRLADFRQLRHDLDPGGKFANEHLSWM